MFENDGDKMKDVTTLSFKKEVTDPEDISILGNLSSIINQNNYEVVSSFKKTTLNINTIKYNVYYLENVNVSNFKYTFKF